MPHLVRRVAPFTALCLALAAVAGCGGDEDSDDVPAPAPDAIATAAQVRAHLQFVMSRAPIPRAQPAVAPTPFTCTSGGSRDVTPATVESPYLQQPLAIEQVTYRNCLQYTGPASDPDSSFTRLDGVEESALVQQPVGATVSYRGSGASQTLPLERQLRSSAPGGVYQEDHYIFSRSHASERNSFFGLIRRLEATEVTLHDLSIRYPDGARFEGSFRFGSVAAPFRIGRRNQQMQLDGEYQIGTARCPTGAMQVETIRELSYDENADRFVAGQLRFSTEGGSAEAMFNADGSVRLTGGDGTQLTEPWSQPMAPWNSECFSATGP